MFEGFWPRMVDNPDAAPTHREIARLDNAIAKVVVSDGLGADRSGAWIKTTEIVRRADAHERIAALNCGSGGDILVFGSRTLWNDLLAAGLVDELHPREGPVALGGVPPPFGRGQPRPFRLLETRRWDGSSNVLLKLGVGAA